MLIPARNASEWTGPTGNNTWLLRGRVPALVDAGVGDPGHLDAVAAALEGMALEVLLITHGHSDHAGGIEPMRARWPGVRVLDAAALAGTSHVSAGDATLRVVATPGHAPDHLCFFDEAAGDLYCGDLVRLGGTIVIPASKGGDLGQYLESLRLVRGLSPRRLLPGHGPPVTEPAQVIDEYIAHRAERERQVIEALAAGCTTPEEIAARIYGPLSPAIAPAAVETVRAHLVKLKR